jgi:hypothetical protein
VADEPIPPHLLDLQRAFNAAGAARRAAARAGEDLAGPMERERAAQEALATARLGTPYEPWEGQKRLILAAKADAGE